MPALLSRKRRVINVPGQVKRFDDRKGKASDLSNGDLLTLEPLLIIRPFGQNHFRTGVLSGAIRG